MNQEHEQRFFTKDEAASLLDVSIRTLHRYVKNGLLDFFFLGNRILFSKSQLLQGLRSESDPTLYLIRKTQYLEKAANKLRRAQRLAKLGKVISGPSFHDSGDCQKVFDEISQLHQEEQDELIQEQKQIDDFLGLHPDEKSTKDEFSGIQSITINPTDPDGQAKADWFRIPIH